MTITSARAVHAVLLLHHYGRAPAAVIAERTGVPVPDVERIIERAERIGER